MNLKENSQPAKDVGDSPVCFVAGTLVHTANGPAPIEKLRVGDLVVTKPERGGEQEYRRVTTTTLRKNLEVCLLQYVRDNGNLDQSAIRSLVLTGDHQVWAKALGWPPTQLLSDGPAIEFADGSSGFVLRILRILKTDIPLVGWTCEDGMDTGPTIDLRNGSVSVSKFHDGDVYSDSAFEINEQLRIDVYAFELDESDACYVGELGVRVRNR